MVDWFLPELYIIYEWADERHCSHEQEAMLKIRILFFFAQKLEFLSILTIICKIYRTLISKVQLVLFHFSFPFIIYNHSATRMTFSLT
jgi:hypothetical protein